ncbi:hypothetical protein [Bordetella trematum]|uniref:hypothetical protein n=1 Tax=Bordetella trematum TaxID=123899 RepID=UPI0011C065EB|nr:hypothetical protein [Bordetella trematum]
MIEVSEADPRVIRLSQPFDWGAGRTPSFCKAAMAWSSRCRSLTGRRYWARLAREPRTAIIVRGEAYNTTTYIITDAENSRRAKPFILTEKDAPNKDGTIPLSAIITTGAITKTTRTSEPDLTHAFPAPPLRAFLLGKQNGRKYANHAPAAANAQRDAKDLERYVNDDEPGLFLLASEGQSPITLRFWPG